MPYPDDVNTIMTAIALSMLTIFTLVTLGTFGFGLWLLYDWWRSWR